MSNLTQYEIRVPGKSTVYTNLEQTAIKYLTQYPQTQLFVRFWFEEDVPPTDRVEVTQLVRQAIARGRERA